VTGLSGEGQKDEKKNKKQQSLESIERTMKVGKEIRKMSHRRQHFFPFFVSFTKR
jgi:hypothetical protein